MSSVSPTTESSEPRRQTKGFKDVFGSTVARALTMPISAIAVLLSSSLITQSRGVEGFALFSIFIALPYMVPISDFGISVSVTDTIAAHGVGSPEFRYVWKRTLMILSAIAGGTIFLAAMLALMGGWRLVLGLPAGRDTELAGFLMMLVMALGIPLGAGQRALLGLGLQTKATVLNSLSGCVSLLLVSVVLAVPGAGYAGLAVAYGAGPLLMQTALFVIAIRNLRDKANANVPMKLHAPVKIFHVALPMAVLSLTLPLTYQTDRVLLAHSSDLVQVANYSFVSMYYVPLLSVITIGSQALWPLFIRNLSVPRRLHRQFLKADRMFSTLGIVMMLGLIFAGPPLTLIVSGGKGDPPTALFIAFGAMLFVFGSNATSGMLLMDHQGRKLQALGAVVMLAIKVPLSIALIPVLGATGTILATLIPMTLCMIVPTRIAAQKRIRKGIT
jgi:O-antigen/teichoic acid export membrane protein